MSKHQLTKRSVRRSLSLTAASAMVFALMPLGSAVAQEATQPEPIGTADVCPPPPDHNTGEAATLTDISGVHADNIRCVVNYDIAEGYPDNTYRPGLDIKRDQMATFIANYVETATGEALAAGDDAFTDDDDNIHEQNINKLAGTGIIRGVQGTTYEPKREVSRAAMATFIANAIDYLDDREVNGSIPPATANDWFPDDDNTTHEPNINRIAEQGIVQGKTDGLYHPREAVTRGQMATFIMHAAEYADELGLWAPTAAQPTGNQDFRVSPQETTVETGTVVELTASGLTSDTADILLLACDDVTTDADGNVTFADADGDGEADFNTADTDAVITEVNGVQGTYGDHVDDATVTDGTVTFNVTSNTEECVVAVVFNDADNNDTLAVDADGFPTEEFGISVITFGNVAQLDAEPEFAVNAFGDIHQVTAQLEDANGEPLAFSDVRVRFTVFRQATSTTGETLVTDTGTAGEAEGGTGNECADLSDPQQVETSTTDHTGLASFSYTVDDPNTAEGDRIFDCIRAEADFDGDGTYEFEDFVAKEWTDAAPEAAALDLDPETDTNLVGTQHTVIAQVTDQFGNPIDTTVTFEVHREDGTTFTETQATGGDGTATFTYAGPATSADDVIIACVDDPTTAGCDATPTFNPEGATLSADEVDDFAVKYWVENAEATDTANGEVVGFDTGADFVDVDDADDANERFQYDTNDTFFVTCFGEAEQPVNINEFEDALSLGDTLQVTAEDATGDREFHLVDEDNSASFCPSPPAA